MFYSQEWLALKPQPVIYEKFFKRFGLKPEECFFIDDLQENVDVSIAC